MGTPEGGKGLFDWHARMWLCHQLMSYPAGKNRNTSQWIRETLQDFFHVFPDYDSTHKWRAAGFGGDSTKQKRKKTGKGTKASGSKEDSNEKSALEKYCAVSLMHHSGKRALIISFILAAPELPFWKIQQVAGEASSSHFCSCKQPSQSGRHGVHHWSPPIDKSIRRL
jgi:hypothetical protein